LDNASQAAVGALAALCLAALVLPRAIGDGTVEAAGRETVGVLSANVHHGTADAAELALPDGRRVRLVDVHPYPPGRGYRDVAGEGLEPTWPDGDFDHPLPPVTIDHVLADRRLGIVEYSVEDLPGTDHHPVHAVLALPSPS
jgi:hypothetical protein